VYSSCIFKKANVFLPILSSSSLRLFSLNCTEIRFNHTLVFNVAYSSTVQQHTWDNSADTVADYDWGSVSETEFSPLRHDVRTGYETHPVYCPASTNVLPSTTQQPGRETDNSPLPSAEVINSLPHTFSWCVAKLHRGTNLLFA
jgi:hypothetical protein